MPYANNKGADQPAHQRRAFVVRCLDSIIPLLAIAELKTLASVCSWAGRFESKLIRDRFSHDEAQIGVQLCVFLFVCLSTSVLGSTLMRAVQEKKLWGSLIALLFYPHHP